MGTGIVSVALADDHQRALSDGLLAIAAGAWVALGVVVIGRSVADRPRIRAEASQPAALTGVAATAVLGERAVQLGWHVIGAALLLTAALSWPLLTVAVMRRIPRRVSGVWFMLTVATEGLARLTASVAIAERLGWLAVIAVALAVAGSCAYPIVLTRFKVGDLFTACGEHWVAGGSLAISALAFAQIALAQRRLGSLAGEGALIEGFALALWVGALAWLPALVIAEVARPRLRYHLQRWSTVFPLGMYAACSFSVARAAHTPWIGDFARGWTWVALAAWALTFAEMLRREPFGRSSGSDSR